ncbi:MAG: 3-deoxy-8-phosphooctulonate synthase [candidate division Zixibacteria bacterium]|nr:3-deoxy-8-phosphooctulonate synthase [candidate division Zixibacteria bacterium]
MSTTLDRIDKGEFFLIAGPCVIESESLCLEIADKVSALANRYEIPYIFKSSFKKANRTAADSYTGPGLQAGLTVLKKIRTEFNIPVLTDIHETTEVERTAEIVDILQIPAFLCRQTDLIVKAAQTGRWVNIKKGQFMHPDDMALAAAKAEGAKVMLTERGSTFGYRNLVVDFRSFVMMKKLGYPVVYDVTHSLQLPGAAGGKSGGQPELVLPMTRAAVAIGIDGLFVETHPNPGAALSDAGSMLPLDKMEILLEQVLKVRKSLK